MITSDPTAQFELVKMDRIPKWNSKDPQIPVVPGGINWQGKTFMPDLADYDGYVKAHDDGRYHVVRTGVTFSANLIPEAFEGGRSAANIRMRDLNRGYSYLMDATVAVRLIADSMSDGRNSVYGRFSLIKRGSNYRLFQA